MELPLGQNQRGHRRHRYRPGTASLRQGFGLGNEAIPANLRPHVNNQRLNNNRIAPRNDEPQQVPAQRNDLNPRMEDPEEGFFLNPEMEARVLAALAEAMNQSHQKVRLFGKKVYAVYKQDGLNVRVETLSRFLSDLADEGSFFFWNGGNTTVINRFLEYLFKRIIGLRQAWNGDFHSSLAYLDSTEMEYLSKFYLAGLKKRTIIPHAALWANVVGDWTPSLSIFFATVFQKLFASFPQPVLAKKLKDWGVIELITNGPQFVDKLTLAMAEIPARDQIINLVNGLSHEMIVDMTSRVLKDNPDYPENLVISKAVNMGYNNRQIVEMIWAGILKRVVASPVKENRIRVFNNIPRIIASREELRGYIEVVKLELFRAMHFPDGLSFLMEEMNTFVGSCLHYGIIKLVDINTWKVTSNGPDFNKENPCHRFILEMDLKGM